MNKKFVKVVVIAAIAVLTALAFTGCGNAKKTEGPKDGKKLKVVTTIFPQYDFVKQIGGDKVDVSMLLKPGAESHSYEPSPQDVIKIQEADLFIYTGGENDEWVDKILDSFGDKKPKVMKLTDLVKTVDEEVVEGMEPEECEADAKDAKDSKDAKADSKDAEANKDAKGEEEEHDVDEHVWTSPENAITITEKISKEMQELDPSNASYFKDNTDKYVKQLKELDDQFKQVVKESKGKTIVVGDRFPLRYFVDHYGLKYHAAFTGCSDQTEANASTISFLIDKVKEEHIPVVFSIELSNGKIANTICEATGAKRLTFYTCHNISSDQLTSGETYLSMMQKNVDSLKQALNY